MRVERYTIEDQIFWTVTIPPPDAVRISLHPVTQALCQTVTGSNPSRFQRQPDSDQRPVESLSWYEAIQFCNALSLRCGLSPCYRIGRGTRVVEWLRGDGFRLPTGAEWLRAARANAHTRYSGGDHPDDVAWFARNSGKETHSVGGRRSNAFGIYDMSGNVKEWCWDPVSVLAPDDLDAEPDLDNSMFSLTVGERLLLGGGWQDAAAFATLDHRNSASPDARRPDIGLRLARSC